MTIKEFIIAETVQSFDNLMVTARKVPAEKLDWKPLDSGRSTLDLAQECALCPLWVPGLLTARAFDPSMFEGFEEAKAKMPTLDDCEAAGRANLETMKEAINSLPDAEMDARIDLPWGKGNYSLREVMTFASWNCTYHMGQVSYIQTLYGDFSM
jgi:hypothetical protein